MFPTNDVCDGSTTVCHLRHREYSGVLCVCKRPIIVVVIHNSAVIVLTSERTSEICCKSDSDRIVRLP
ncbi:MAG: hypothetical protein HY735_01555 [Verrucomicrobia bacterium]|nr:hypothetical protein [Verrucomicrobiota bacterium]